MNFYAYRQAANDLLPNPDVMLGIANSGEHAFMAKRKKAAPSGEISQLETEIESLIGSLPPEHARIRQLMDRMGAPRLVERVIYTSSPACNSPL